MKCRRMIYIMFLTSVIGIFTACSPTAYAANAETLAVNAAWADGDLIKISVTDKNGTESTLALRLSDHIDDTTANEYITVQAVDLEGNKSGTIQIKNPHYIKSADITVEIMSTEVTEAGKPFTPDGSGTVMDNVFDDNGKEIFSIMTESEAVFYLIVDRERTSDNVYLLNAVTEEDLMALAQKNGRTINPPTIAMPTTEIVTSTVQAEQTAAHEPDIKDKMGGFDNMTVIFIIAVAAVGGLGYYFKIHKKKKQATVSDDSDDEEIDEYPNNASNDLDDDSEDGDDEDE